MRTIRLENITKRFNGEAVLENLTLTIPSGQFFALLGPSGSGKTTLLRLIAGFEEVDSGKIFLDDQNITHVPINERKVNTVFQQYALFPHMNVFDNVAYGLKIKGVKPDIIEQKVLKVLASFGLQKHVYKSIQQLSGGQQQRVTLARAIINEPEVLLLDEPLAALDFNLREKVLLELIELQSSLKTTFVYVTHDQLEALTVADYMAIMNADGEIEQIGTPEQIYEFPVSSFVANFVGNSNILSGVINSHEHKQYFYTEGLSPLQVVVPEYHAWFKENQPLLMSLRPEKIEICKQRLEGFSNHVTGVVQAIIYHGRSTKYSVQVAPDKVLQVFQQNEEHFPKETIDQGDEVHLYWQKENVVLLER